MKPLMERFERLLEFAPEEEVDLYSKKQLRKRLFNWKNRDREYLCKIDYFVNGKEYTSLAESIYQIEDLKKIKLKFIKPNLEGDWHFSKPTKELMEKKGKGVFKTFNYDPYSLEKWTSASKVKTEKVMVRAYLTKYFAPISIKTKSQYHHARDVPARYVPELKNLEDLWADFRDGVVPLEMRLCVYTQNKRYAYIIDAIGDGQIPHPLNHISLPNEAQREPIDYMHIDRILAKYDLPELLKKILELLFHSHELSLPDIAHYFKMGTKVAENSLNSLVNKGLVEVRKNVYYKISMENVRETARSLK
ncbi:MAG: hypothetical protein ACOC1V_05065 [Candidatus Saliniplasma sp.]